MLTREELEHVARVARIALSDDEVEELLPQFQEIFRLLEQVKSLPLDDVSFINTTDNANEFREDAVSSFENPDEIVAQFPRRKDRYAKVPPNL